MPRLFDTSLIQRLGSILGMLLFAAFVYGLGAMGWVSENALYVCVLSCITLKVFQEWISAAYQKRLLFWSGCGFLAVGLGAFCFLFYRGKLLFVISVAVMTDTAAYLCGRLMKGPKLWPSVSPQKTWSGALGSLFCVTTVFVLCGYNGVLVCLLCLAAQGGDLLQSFVKRTLRLKDMGSCFPGHGGFLDRMDSWLMAAIVGSCLYVFADLLQIHF